MSSSQSKPLIIRLRNWVGDVILGVPAIQLLERHGYQPILVGKGWAPSLLEGFGWTVHKRPGRLGDRIAQFRQLRSTCRSLDPRFDDRTNTVLLPTSFSSALEARLAGLRASGYRSEGRALMLSSSPTRKAAHELQAYWELASTLMGSSEQPPAAIAWKVSEAARRQVEGLIEAHGLEGGFIVVCPFAGGLFEKQEKTWPEFKKLVDQAAVLGRPIVALPGPGEEETVRDFTGLTLLPNVNLSTYAALLARCDLMITNDTGPAHLAAAVGAPVLSVLGPTKPEQWRPWGPTVRLVRHWPRWPTVEEVLAAAQQMLSELPGATLGNRP